MEEDLTEDLGGDRDVVDEGGVGGGVLGVGGAVGGPGGVAARVVGDQDGQEGDH